MLHSVSNDMSREKKSLFYLIKRCTFPLLTFAHSGKNAQPKVEYQVDPALKVLACAVHVSLDTFLSKLAHILHCNQVVITFKAS